MRKPVAPAEVVKFVSVEAREAFTRAKPQVSARVSHNAVYRVVRKTLGSGCSGRTVSFIPHVRIQECEHVRLPNAHTQKGKVVSIICCTADWRIDFQAMPFTKLRQPRV